MTIQLHDRCPAFKLACKPGEEVDLETVIGSKTVVLLFMPLAFSPVCTLEVCLMRDQWTKWQTLGAAVFGITVDSPFVTEKFRQLENVPFPILSDFNKVVATQFGVLHEDLKGMKGIAKRSVFVIDRSGIVTYRWVTENPGQQIDFAALEAAVATA
ncbi:MAG: redoxin domain-containing protein [Phycisphaerales bacterium]|nr:redoxin domain-containing protein [Phycisphaerales bacterium]